MRPEVLHYLVQIRAADLYPQARRDARQAPAPAATPETVTCHGGLADPDLRGVRPVTAPMPELCSSPAYPGWAGDISRNSMIATMPLAMPTGSVSPGDRGR
jgi:hypothetical protein